MRLLVLQHMQVGIATFLNHLFQTLLRQAQPFCVVAEILQLFHATVSVWWWQQNSSLLLNL